MRIGMVLEGDLRALLFERYDALATVVTDAVNRNSLGLRDDLRRQSAAIFKKGDRGVVKAWQQRLYPSRRRGSMGAAGFVYSKARNIHAAFVRPMTVSARGGRWLVIPLEGAIRRGWDREGRDAGAFGKPRKWSAFGQVMKVKGIAWMPQDNGNVIVGLRRRGQAPERLFLLARTARLKGGLDLDATAQRWLDRLYSELAQSIGG